MAKVRAITITVTLSEPIKRGEEEIKSILLRKPDSGSYRGLTLTDLIRMDVDSIAEIVPRLSLITAAEFNKLEPYDLMQVSKSVVRFLTTPLSVLAAEMVAE